MPFSKVPRQRHISDTSRVRQLVPMAEEISFDREKWQAIGLIQDAVQYHRDNGNVDMALSINVYLIQATKQRGEPSWLFDLLNKTRDELWEMV